MSENPTPTVEALQETVITWQRKIIEQLERKIELQESVICSDLVALSLVRQISNPTSN